MKYLCFHLMFHSKINQVILVSILLFLNVKSVLQMIFFVTFHFFKFLFDQTIIVLDRYYFQTNKIITKSIGIILQKVDASITFCSFLEKLVTFLSFICLKTSVFLLLFSSYYLALFIFLIIDLQNI